MRVAEGPWETIVRGEAAGDQRAVADAIFAAWQAWRIALMDPSQENEDRLSETTMGELLASEHEFLAAARANEQYSTVDPARPPSLTVIAGSIRIENGTASAEMCWYNSGITMQRAADGDVVLDDSDLTLGFDATTTRVDGRWLVSNWQQNEGLASKCASG